MATFAVTVACAAGVSFSQCPLVSPQSHDGWRAPDKHTCLVGVYETISKFHFNPKNFVVDCKESK